MRGLYSALRGSDLAYFLFVDESGNDRRDSPYEVLAGVCVEDRDLWNLIDAINDAEERILGTRYSRAKEEIKARKFLKRKVFKHANQLPPFPDEDRRVLARDCIDAGPKATRSQISALAQAKLAFVAEVFDLCAQYRCNAFASIIDRNAPRPAVNFLRKDYSYLFERFFYFLEDRGPNIQGAIVFDELDKSQAHILLNQMEEYFLNTSRGRQRSRQVIPEPFFVHSDLTSLIQVADLVAYVISNAFRTSTMTEPARQELQGYADQVAALRYRTTREQMGRPDFQIWSFAIIGDLRALEDRQ